ncbi:hypothetical protein Droror1_Dr00001963 [Drosera rotundifolia]
MLGVHRTSKHEPDPEVIRKDSCLTEDQKRGLVHIFEHADVKNAQFEIDDLKTPGSDWFSVLFLKKAWPIIGEEITKVVLSFFRATGTYEYRVEDGYKALTLDMQQEES